jgi:hypothetical protein
MGSHDDISALDSAMDLGATASTPEHDSGREEAATDHVASGFSPACDRDDARHVRRNMMQSHDAIADAIAGADVEGKPLPLPFVKPIPYQIIPMLKIWLFYLGARVRLDPARCARGLLPRGGLRRPGSHCRIGAAQRHDRALMPCHAARSYVRAMIAQCTPRFRILRLQNCDLVVSILHYYIYN